jgi:hypothetical protein
MKIALLEDNPINSEYIQTLLRMEGQQIFPTVWAIHFYQHFRPQMMHFLMT